MYVAPIRVVRQGNQVTISANLKFMGKLANELFEDTNETYAQLAVKGIINCWQGRYQEHKPYDLFGYDYVDVTVNINNNNFTQSLDFHIDNSGRGFTPYNIGWDISGNIFNGLYCFAFQDHKYYNYEHFTQLAAHEFGHLIGLGDAYADTWQNEAPESKETPIEFIMRDTAPYVMSNDIEMVLEAFKTNSLQNYYPKYLPFQKSDVIRAYATI